MTDPLDERLRSLLAPAGDAPRPSLDTHQRLVVRARRRRRRRTVVSTALGVALLGSGAAAVPQLLPERQPDSVGFADQPAPGLEQADPEPRPDGPPPLPSPGLPPPPRLVASTVGGQHAIVLYDVLDAERVRELAPADDDLVLTGLSADGSTAYAQSLEVQGCGRENLVLDVESGERRVLTPGDRWPFAVASPDGTRVAALERPEDYAGGDLVCEGDGTWDLVLVDTTTGERRRYADASLDGFVGIELAWSPDGRHVAFQRYGVDRGVSGVLTILDTQAPEAPVVEAGQTVASECATRSPAWADSTRLAYLEVCPDGSNRLVLRVVGDRAVVPERRGLPPRDPAAYGPQDLDLDASGQHAVWADDNRLFALDLGPVDAEVRDLGIEGVSPHW